MVPVAHKPGVCVLAESIRIIRTLGEVCPMKDNKLIHIVSNTEVCAMDSDTVIGHMALCLEVLRLKDGYENHPVGKGLSRSGPDWDKVTCEPCRKRHQEFYR